MQSISGIITQIRSSKGEVPPPLVGPSVTMAGDQLFVFGGRLVSTRKMTNQLFVMDVNTQTWIRHIPSPDSDKPPTPRYFHSASVYKRSLIIFGGMGYTRQATTAAAAAAAAASAAGTASTTGSVDGDGVANANQNASGLCVVEDISILDLDTMTWRRPMIQPSLFSPRARYAHLADVVDDKLLVIGGQDMNNSYLPEMNILDLKTWEWVQVKSFDKHVGAYRSIAVATPPGTRLPATLKDTMGDETTTGTTSHLQQQHMTTAADDDGNNNSKSQRRTSFLRQQGQFKSLNEEPSPVYLYTNYNFTDVKRELQLVFMSSANTNTPVVEDCSSFMTGSTMPPGLRFPTGHTLGHHMILAGTYLSPQSQSFSIWALNLGTLTWAKIETGAIFSTGSWNRGVLHEGSNRFLVFGNQQRELLEDYNHRQTNFDQMAVVDLEAFGVYQLPRITCSTLAQEMGLSLLNEPAVSDFFIVTRENQEIPVNSAVLAQRWPYFADLMEINKTTAPMTNGNGKLENHHTIDEGGNRHSTIMENDDDDNDSDGSNDDDNDDNDNEDDNDKDDNNSGKSSSKSTNGISNTNNRMMKSHSILFPYSYPVVIALLQFIYTDNLLTAQQYQPHILAQLLLLSDMYELPRLKTLATHALHQMLNMSTAPLIFETAALSHQTSLQIRALKMMIAAKKMIQQQQMIQAGVNMDHSTSSNDMTLPMSNSSSAHSASMDSGTHHTSGFGSDGGGRNSSVSPGSISPFASLSSARESPTPFSSRQQQQSQRQKRDTLSSSPSTRRSPPVQPLHSPASGLTSPTSSSSSSRLDRYSTSIGHDPSSRHSPSAIKGRSTTTLTNSSPQRATSPVHRYSTSTTNSLLSPPISATSFTSGAASGRVMSMSPPSTPRKYSHALDAIDPPLPPQQDSKPKGKKNKMKGTAKSFFGGKLFS
ncbi:unnamed protein product [Absidia cylindrospora]